MCAPSEDSDQPAHSRSLIRIFTVRILHSQGCKVSSCGQRRLKSDCADAQADLSLRWAHMREGTFTHVVTHSKYPVSDYKGKWSDIEACMVKIVYQDRTYNIP